MANRTRPNQILFFVSDEEKRIIKAIGVGVGTGVELAFSSCWVLSNVISSCSDFPSLLLATMFTLSDVLPATQRQRNLSGRETSLRSKEMCIRDRMRLESIGKNIRKYRLMRKLRQEDLAEKADLSINLSLIHI